MMKKMLIAVALFIVVVLGITKGAVFFRNKVETKPAAPVVTGSYNAEDSADSPVTGSQYRDIEWDDLMPRNWNPVKSTEGLNIEELEDNDPRAVQALQKTLEAWKHAPINPSMNDTDVRIGGFVVALEYDGRYLKEFLLVPYYGACIHTPPPPPNQIIHVVLEKPVAGISSLDAVWVKGKLHTEKTETREITSGYTLKRASVTPYTGEPRP